MPSRAEWLALALLLALLLQRTPAAAVVGSGTAKGQPAADDVLHRDDDDEQAALLATAESVLAELNGLLEGSLGEGGTHQQDLGHKLAGDAVTASGSTGGDSTELHARSASAAAELPDDSRQHGDELPAGYRSPQPTSRGESAFRSIQLSLVQCTGCGVALVLSGRCAGAGKRRTAAARRQKALRSPEGMVVLPGTEKKGADIDGRAVRSGRRQALKRDARRGGDTFRHFDPKSYDPTRMWQTAASLFEACPPIPPGNALDQPCRAAEESLPLWQTLAQLLDPDHTVRCICLTSAIRSQPSCNTSLLC